MDTDQPQRQFTCPACEHVTPYDPARCRPGMRVRRGKYGLPERTKFIQVRCAGCGRQGEVSAGPG
jgi:ribosomal protein S27E